MDGPHADVHTLFDALSAWATATPDAPALLAPGRAPVSYRELHDAVDRLATELRARGLSRHDGIAVLMPEGPDYAVAMLAAISVGVAVPLTWPTPPAEYRRPLASGRVHAVLVGDGIRSTEFDLPQTDVLWLPLASDSAGRLHVGGDASRRSDTVPAPTPLPSDTALILQSSGTTGRPKLVPVTHRAIASTCETMIAGRGLTPADRCLNPVKLAYAQGFYALAIPIAAGAALISIPELDFDALPQWLGELAPTYLTATPGLLRLLAAQRDDVRSALRQAPLRCINCTAGALSPGEIVDLQSLFGAPILNLYGMTEAAAIASEVHEGGSRVPGSVGLPWCDVQILDQDLQPLPATERGEIVVRSPRVAACYIDDAEATAAAFLPGGWFRTGDIGRLDHNGYLYLTGRLGEVINRGGEKISPVEIDDLLRRHPAVADAAVFAVVDERLGEDIVAAIALREGMSVSPRAMRTWLAARVAQFKAPRRIWFVQALPRTPTGKVQRGELARRWAEERR